MQTPPLNFKTFSEPITLREIVLAIADSGTTRGKQVVIVLVAALCSIACGVGILFAFFTFASWALPLTILFLLGLGLLGILGVASSVVFVRAVRTIRLKRFAEANNFSFSLHRSTDQPGLIFTLGHSRHYTTVVSGKYKNLPFEMGNFFCTIGSGRSSKLIKFGVVAIELTRALPHVLLDAKANNWLGFSNLPAFSSSQLLTLEGNFNKYFDLYVPKGYERDALYFITPELMVLLIDLGAQFDIEIIDNRLYMYGSKEFTFEKTETIRTVFQLIDVLGGEVQENTRRYADARIPRSANVIAQPGKRLKRSGVWVIAGLLLLWIMFVVVASFLNKS